MQAGWSEWQHLKMTARAAVMYGCETVPLIKKQEAELKMLSFALGVIKMDRIRN